MENTITATPSPYASRGTGLAKRRADSSNRKPAEPAMNAAWPSPASASALP